jgi:hypothetical protein
MLQQTVSRATIPARTITVITFLRPIAANADNAIATDRLTARCRAIILIESVSIIADLARIEAPIAARFCQATVRTTISSLSIAIITILKPLVFWGSVVAYDAITTSGDLTCVGAEIGLDQIAVVTILVVDVPKAITATSRCTCRSTSIVISFIAIIAQLTLLQTAIATAWQLTFSTGVCRVCVPVITLFVRSLDAVTATSSATVAQTLISFDGVAIVALLIACSPRKRPLPTDTIAASCSLASTQTGVGIIGVAVVAGFIPLFTLRLVQTSEAIATTSLLTTPAAGIVPIPVPIIAGFVVRIVWTQTCPEDSVATNRQLTVRSARIRVVQITVITALTRLQ